MSRKIKEKIIEKLTDSLIDLNINGIETQFPINIYYVQPNLNKFENEIYVAIKKNINSYSELMLSQLLLLLIDRDLNCSKYLFNLILDKLIEKRKDPTLNNSLELNYKKDLNFEFKELKDYKKYILWSEILIDINYPIFRGYGFNVYTINDIFYKEYDLPEGKFIISAKIIKIPKYYFTGHNKDVGLLKDYKYFGKQPKEPIVPKFESKKEAIKYSADLILKRLGVRNNIKIDDIILEKEYNLKRFNNYTEEQIINLKNKMTNNLILKMLGDNFD
jgi:hypothetical protein